MDKLARGGELYFGISKRNKLHKIKFKEIQLVGFYVGWEWAMRIRPGKTKIITER